MVRTKRIGSGDRRTVEWFWNASGTAFFQARRGARITVRSGVGWFGFHCQKQTLDGQTIKKLSVGTVSVARARLQARVPQTTDVSSDVYPGNVSITTPEFEF